VSVAIVFVFTGTSQLLFIGLVWLTSIKGPSMEERHSRSRGTVVEQERPLLRERGVDVSGSPKNGARAGAMRMGDFIERNRAGTHAGSPSGSRLRGRVFGAVSAASTLAARLGVLVAGL